MVTIEENKMYFIYILDKNGYDKKEQRVTDYIHFFTCVRTAKEDWNVDKVCVNKADFCANGYLVQGEYLGKC